jgi:hypothetical protein
MIPQQLKTIAQDTSCRPCGYNLRGLSPWGKCPECGGDIQGTLRAIREGAIKTLRLDDVDPVMLNQWIEGLWCVVTWFAIDAIADFEVVQSRQLQLATYVTGWAIGYLGMWKIARGRIVLRACLVFGGLFPFVWGLESLPVQHWPGPEVLLFLLGIIATTALLHFRLARIARLVPSLPLVVQFYSFIVTVAFGTFLVSLAFADFNMPQSLEMMQSLPSPAFITTFWIYALHHGLWFNGTYIRYGISALLAWAPVIVIVLLVKLLLARARLRTMLQTTDTQTKPERRKTNV